MAITFGLRGSSNYAILSLKQRRTLQYLKARDKKSSNLIYHIFLRPNDTRAREGCEVTAEFQYGHHI